MHGTKAGIEVDRKFLDSARQLHGNNAHFRPTPDSFVIKHYAGEVTVSISSVYLLFVIFVAILCFCAL